MTKEPSDERKASILLLSHMSQIKHNYRMVSHTPAQETKCVCKSTTTKILVLVSGWQKLLSGHGLVVFHIINFPHFHYCCQFLEQILDKGIIGT